MIKIEPIGKKPSPLQDSKEYFLEFYDEYWNEEDTKEAYDLIVNDYDLFIKEMIELDLLIQIDN